MTAEGFERLVRRYRSEIFRTVFRRSRSREDAEDLTQITFLNAYTAFLHGADPEAPRAWLHAIARNAGARRFHQSRLTEVELDADAPLAADDDDDLSVHELQAALARLTFNQRAALLMREVGGLSANEIGARLGISPGAVATLLFRARRALRTELDGQVESRLARLGLLYATILRQSWGRLVAPILDGSEALSRTAAVVGLAAAATGVAGLTGGAPIAAHAGQLRAVVQAASPAPVVHVAAPVRSAPAEPRSRAARLASRTFSGPSVKTVPAPVAHSPAPAVATHRAVRPPPAPAARSTTSPQEGAPAPPSVPSTAPAPAAQAPPQQPAAAPEPPSAPATEQPVVPTLPTVEPVAAVVPSAVPAVPAPDVAQVTAALPADAAAAADAVPVPVPAAIVPPPLPPPPLPSPPAAPVPAG